MGASKKDAAYDRVSEGSSCFAAHAKRRLPCLKQTCRMWLDSPEHLNCTLLAICQNNCCAMTLQQIGDIHGLTRMRVCQIEKRAIEKVKTSLFTVEKK